MKKILILSPHLDDSVLSCGDLIAKYVKRGCLVDVLTIFSGSDLKSSLCVNEPLTSKTICLLPSVANDGIRFETQNVLPFPLLPVTKMLSFDLLS